MITMIMIIITITTDTITTTITNARTIMIIPMMIDGNDNNHINNFHINTIRVLSVPKSCPHLMST